MSSYGQESLLSMVLSSGPVVQGVLIILILLSLWSWTITIAKAMQYSKARKESKEFSGIFWEARNLSRIGDSCDRFLSSPLVTLFKRGSRELKHILEDGKDSIDEEEAVEALTQVLRRAELDEAEKLEQGITFLATVASAAPFIGLFGTVWGIMNAFHGLSSMQTTTLQAVAPGISEALVATAIGLAAAIPAAIAYNYFAVALRQFRQSMSRFSDEFVMLSRHYVS